MRETPVLAVADRGVALSGRSARRTPSSRPPPRPTGAGAALPPPPARGRPGPTLATSFDPRSNSLVAASHLRLNSLRRCVRYRALRILRGFRPSPLLTALGTAPLPAVLTGRSAASVFTGPESALSHLVANATLLVRHSSASPPCLVPAARRTW